MWLDTQLSLLKNMLESSELETDKADHLYILNALAPSKEGEVKIAASFFRRGTFQSKTDFMVTYTEPRLDLLLNDLWRIASSMLDTNKYLPGVHHVSIRIDVSWLTSLEPGNSKLDIFPSLLKEGSIPSISFSIFQAEAQDDSR